MQRFLIGIKYAFVHAGKWFGLYLATAGLITFNMFILEEAFQTCMFGSWPAVDVGEYRLVKQNMKTMEGLHHSLVGLNYLGGWINPFAFIAYNGYAKAEVEYMAGLKAKVFANAPEVFEGEEISFHFEANEWEPIGGDGWIGRNGRLAILTAEQYDGTRLQKGIVQIKNDRVIIDCRR